MSLLGSVRMVTVAMLNVKKHKTVPKPQKTKTHTHTPPALSPASHTHSHTRSYNGSKQSTDCVATDLSTHTHNQWTDTNPPTCTHTHTTRQTIRGLIHGEKPQGAHPSIRDVTPPSWHREARRALTQHAGL